MNARDDLDRRLGDWMAEIASSPAPAAALEQVVEASAQSRPRHRWLAPLGSDWIGRAGPRQFDWAWPGERREFVAAVLVALSVAVAIVGAALVGAQIVRPDRGPFPDSDINGWIAFDADSETSSSDPPDHDVYIVGQDRIIRRIVGTDGDNLDQICPAFSADGTRLAFGQAHGTDATGYTSSSLGIVDIDADGHVSNMQTIPVGGAVPAPCPIWSPDGRRIAFYFEDAWNGNYARPREAGSVWMVTLDSMQMTELPDMWAKSIDWAPDGSRLAIASGNDPAIFPPVGGPILIYSVATKELIPLSGATDATAVSWSPDGNRIAYQRVRTPGSLVGEGILAGTDTQEIWTIVADGRGRTLQTNAFGVNHGGGPDWSPAGDRIAYMRVCAEHPVNAGPCREQHDVVILTPATTVVEIDAVGSEVVLPLARADMGQGPVAWFPFTVSWSPDGHRLLYTAWREASVNLPTGILVVDVDGRSPPILLDVSMQSAAWGRLPGS